MALQVLTDGNHDGFHGLPGIPNDNHVDGQVVEPMGVEN